MSHFMATVGAKRRRVELIRNDGGSATPSLTSAEEDMQKDNMLRVEVLPGGACIEPLPGPDSSFISVSGHPVLLLPVTKTEPESLSSDETDVSDTHFEGRQTEDIKALYCRYLKKEIENRDQQMAYRALKMKKLEKKSYYLISSWCEHAVLIS
ncbi:hypothetical protein INR49_025600 [Caranx melampygus]|nr:hypothetical protein INR49_025600 [Caranx melampygus]